MVYQAVSSKEVITRIIRKTRLTDTSYLEDMKVWIPEGINSLKTQHILQLVALDVDVNNYVAMLPKDLSSLEAVIYNSKRMRMSSSVVPLNLLPTLSNRQIDTYVTNLNHSAINTVDKYRGEHLEPVDSCNVDATYKLQLGCLHTSFPQGKVTLVYKKLPVDSEGYILIPDNTNYKQALEWYVYQQMVFSGYSLPDKRMDYAFCTQEFERFGGRAIAEIIYPSVDKVESTYRATSRLIFPQHYWEDFGAGMEQIQEINK